MEGAAVVEAFVPCDCDVLTDTAGAVAGTCDAVAEPFCAATAAYFTGNGAVRNPLFTMLAIGCAEKFGLGGGSFVAVDLLGIFST